ncbi:MAG: beta-galactosidase [Acidobacteriaceae bacterium]|nr:beta-galactosidase [Acidobacteriaceae bacterium]
MFTHLGGFESTHIFGAGQDILGTTRHIEFWREDLRRLLNAGIRLLRYSIPWHRIEKQRRVFDWEWMDRPLRFMKQAGMQPIADPLHHTSFPEWLTDGFLHPEFPCLYSRFVAQVHERYPFIRSYTVFNEPLPTTLFCSYTGLWYPHHASDRHFVAMALQTGRAICLACETLKRHDRSIEFLHVDTAEHHQPLERRCTEWVQFANARRFLMTDLVLGRVRRDHELYHYLISNGATDKDLKWFQDHRATISTLGLDYYIHSEMAWFWCRDKARPDIAGVNPSPRGFASVAEDYITRYNLPVMLSETNVRGTVRERIGWLKFMESECEELVLSGHDFRGFCWYPSIDTTDWWNLVRQATGQTDPQGIWSLHPKQLTRIDTELSRTYSRLARGEICSRHIPVLGFGPELQRRLRGYKRISCGSWDEPAKTA